MIDMKRAHKMTKKVILKNEKYSAVLGQMMRILWKELKAKCWLNLCLSDNSNSGRKEVISVLVKIGGSYYTTGKDVARKRAEETIKLYMKEGYVSVWAIDVFSSYVTGKLKDEGIVIDWKFA